MKSLFSFNHQGVTYLTHNRILSIQNDIVTFEVWSKGQRYECLIDFVDIEVLKNRIGLNAGYLMINSGKLGSLHRMIIARKGQQLIGRTITCDHENRNTLDNRRCNLNARSAKEQRQNQRKYSQCGSKFFYVSKTNSNKWSGYTSHKHGRHLKYFDTELEAVSYANELMRKDPEYFAKKLAHNEQLLKSIE